MKKILRAMSCMLVGGSLLLATACGCGKSSGLDSESRALNLAIGALDGNFNPFFYTSQNDGEIIGMTQVSLLGVDRSGKPAVGDNYPVVAKDYTITYYTEREDGSATEDSSLAKRTEYEFLIKNGLKFSDGSDLTIKDVLFNFYVYLDPAYTGSNTMYSVDIQGLAAYQDNNAALGLDGELSSSSYAANAQARVQAIIDWSSNESTTVPPENDIKLVASLFEEELNSDWSAIETSWQTTYETNFNFKYAWQAYLFQEGIVKVQEKKTEEGTTYQVRVNDKGVEVTPDDKDYDKAKNLTNLDPWVQGAIEGGAVGSVDLQYIFDEIAEATAGVADDSYEYLQLTKEYCIDRVYSIIDADPNSGGYGRGFDQVLSLWATGSSAYSAFLADERGQAIKNSNDPIYYIKGIQTSKTSTFNGKNLGAEHYVLKIAINDVDPAAIWNFGVSIAPISYYSGTYEGVNYINEATAWNNGGVAEKDGQFGVKRGEFNFFEKVVKGTDSGKSTLPKGAGAYVASTQSGKVATSGSDFENNNIVYYQRNEHFHTMGANIENAKIKYLQYKVLADDRIIPALNTGAIDYGQPTATQTNLGQVDGNKSYRIVTFDTNGYGYVGINPTYVPDVEIRRLIMRAMTITDAVSYYGDLASPIYRPMSSTSWAYPQNCKTPKELETVSSATEISNWLTDNGYPKSGSKFLGKDGKPLSYTFTIAGASSDHPAYGMFMNAANILNQAGFDIKVSTSANALRDLTQGTLAVWAAAYSTAVDPDMYQVYHKDSQATSILNWGYRSILNDTTGKYNYELNIINDLSNEIEKARKTLDEETRKNSYEKCLNYVMDLAIQLPIYQRADLCVFNKKVLDEKTVNLNANNLSGVLDRIWEVDYVK